MLQVGGRYYNFICNKPKNENYRMFTGIDDDSKYFADRCSYGFFDIPEDQVKKKVKGHIKRKPEPKPKPAQESKPEQEPEPGNTNQTYG